MIGYLFIILFLGINGAVLWFTPTYSLLEGAEADLIPFFNFTPMFFLVLIPALTMRSIAEERRTGTIEFLFTKPISDFGIISAKFLASFTLLLVALLPTLVYYYSVVSLSLNPEDFDHGATITSYLGLILLGASFIAIGIFSSALSSNQIVAFVLANSICWVFVPSIGGISLLGNYNLFGSLDTIVQYIGMDYHYEAIKKGVIDTKNVVYFLSIIFLFIYAALTVVKSIKK